MPNPFQAAGNEVGREKLRKSGFLTNQETSVEGSGTFNHEESDTKKRDGDGETVGKTRAQDL